MRAVLSQPGGPSGQPGVASSAAWGPACASHGPRAKRIFQALPCGCWTAKAGGPCVGTRRTQFSTHSDFPVLRIYSYVRSFACYHVEVSPFGQYPEEVLPEGECENGTPNT